MDYTLPSCRVIPLPDHQVSFEVEGREALRWHYGPNYPRPFFFPLRGPSGGSLTRMGHPGAPNHDHHRSVWFAHNKVLGIDFWGDRPGGQPSHSLIRQEDWLSYLDGDDFSAMAVDLGWYDGHDPKRLLRQRLVAALIPDEQRQYQLELQSTFQPESQELEFGRTNFGFLAVRVAKSIAAHFGGGRLTDSEGRTGERAIFGQASRWVDYSGPVPASPAGVRNLMATEGITYFDHSDNLGYPQKWHVRDDGWMGASVCRDQPRTITKSQPLTYRFLLDIHAGACDPDRAARLGDAFNGRPALRVEKSTAPHESYRIVR